MVNGLKVVAYATLSFNKITITNAASQKLLNHNLK